MNQIATSQWNLPDKIEDLARFALIGREKMTAVRAEIRAIEKLGLAEEVRRQKLEEAQLISEAVLDAEVRIGTLTAALPKAAGRTNTSGGTEWGTSGDTKTGRTTEEGRRPTDGCERIPSKHLEHRQDN